MLAGLVNKEFWKENSLSDLMTFLKKFRSCDNKEQPDLTGVDQNTCCEELEERVTTLEGDMIFLEQEVSIREFE